MSYKRWIVVAVCLFGIGFGIGLAMPTGLTDLLSEELAALGELGARLAPFQIFTAIFILVKNISAVLLSFMLSPILCLFPVMALIFNGLVISFVSAIVVQEKSIGFVLAGLLPHGIIELPAFIIGEAAALSFGTMVMLALFKKEARGQLPLNLRRNLRYLVITFALFLPAAIIETYVTPLFLSG